MSVNICKASGWNDFILDIGDGYIIFQANSMEVGVGIKNGKVIIYPLDHNMVGPVIQYITTPKFIYTRSLGRKPRNLFNGDTFQDVDTSQEFFFIHTKGTNETIGPLSKKAFVKQLEIGKYEALKWQVPKNPNFWLPFLGTLMFLVISIPILAIKFYWVSLPLLVLLILLVRNRKLKKT